MRTHSESVGVLEWHESVHRPWIQHRRCYPMVVGIQLTHPHDTLGENGERAHVHFTRFYLIFYLFELVLIVYQQKLEMCGECVMARWGPNFSLKNPNKTQVVSIATK